MRSAPVLNVRFELGVRKCLDARCRAVPRGNWKARRLSCLLARREWGGLVAHQVNCGVDGEVDVAIHIKGGDRGVPLLRDSHNIAQNNFKCVRLPSER